MDYIQRSHEDQSGGRSSNYILINRPHRLAFSGGRLLGFDPCSASADVELFSLLCFPPFHIFFCHPRSPVHPVSVHLFLYLPSYLVHQDFEKISEFFKANYKVELTEKDMCVKGWNWGTAKFSGKKKQHSINGIDSCEVNVCTGSFSFDY